MSTHLLFEQCYEETLSASEAKPIAKTIAHWIFESVSKNKVRSIPASEFLRENNKDKNEPVE